MLAVGQEIAGKYRLVAPLGEGGFGVVWTAVQIGLRRTVAIKFLRASMGRDAERRFALEARALASLNHPHCVTLLDFGRMESGASFLVTEFLDGPMLREWLARGPTLAARIEIAQQIAAALSAAHQANILHRDLKPDNVIVLENAEGPRAMVLDFGIAKLSGVVAHDVTKTGEVFGTPGFMSPEQLRASVVDHRSDIYALGVILFEMFEGRPPFGGASALELAMKHLQDDAPEMSHGPHYVRELVASMLAKEPSGRPGSMQVVHDALSLDQNQRTTQVGVTSADDRAARTVWPWLLGATAVAVLAWALWPDGDPRREELPPQRRHEVSILKSAHAPTPADVGVDLSADASVVIDAGSRVLCNGARIDRGMFNLYDDPAHPLLVYVPDSYVADGRGRAVIMFHDLAIEPATLLQYPDLVERADRDGTVLLAPFDAGTPTPWLRRDQFIPVFGQLVDALTALCVNNSRVFAIGFGRGGRPAHMLDERGPKIAALTTTAHRFNAADFGGPGVPMLYLAPLRDGFGLVEGGDRCGAQSSAISLADHEKGLRRGLRCRKTRESQHPHGICYDDRCTPALVRCHIDGGRFWPGLESSFFGLEACAGRSVDFPYAQVVWDFFDKHDKKRPDPK